MRISYAGNGSTTVFAGTWRIADDDDVKVISVASDDTATTQTKTTHYTVSGVGDSTFSITMLTAPASGVTLVLLANAPLTQTNDIRNQGSFFPETHEEEFDKLTRIAQQLNDQADRSPHFPDEVNPSTFDNEFPSGIIGEASLVPLTNEDGDGWAAAEDWITGDEIANAQTYATQAAASAAAAAVSAGTLSPYGINNLGLSATVSTNALTVAILEADGTSTPSIDTDSVTIYFRSTTATNGSMTARSVVSATTVVVPSGATLGHNDALADYVYIYAIDNSGTIELAVSSSNHWDEGQVQSTTAIGTGSDDASGIYSTSARTNVAVRLIGRFLSTQTTAGTWASAVTRLEVGFLFKREDNIFARAANFIPKHGNTYLVSTAAARTVTLPTPVSGFRCKFIDSTQQAATNNITLARAGSESIQGVAASYVLSRSGGSWELTSNGTDWFLSTATPKKSITVFNGPTSGNQSVPTTFASPTLSAAALTVGVPVTRATNVLTFPWIGIWRVMVSFGNITGAGTNTFMSRWRNTTDASDVDKSTAGSGDDQNQEMTMYGEITSIAKNYEIQFGSTNSAVTLNAPGIDSDTAYRWRIVIEFLENTI
jgi:hypothetical protein